MCHCNRAASSTDMLLLLWNFPRPVCVSVKFCLGVEDVSLLAVSCFIIILVIKIVIIQRASSGACVWKSEDYQNCRVNSIISTLLSDNIVIVCIVFVILSLCCWTMYQLCSVHNFISYSVDCRCCCRLHLNYSCEMLPFNTSVVTVSAYSEKAKYICSLYAVFCFHLWYTLLENLYVFTWRLSLVADQRSWLLLLIATQLSFVYCKTGQNDSCYCCGYCLIIIVSQSAFIVVFSLVSLVIVCWSYFHSQWQLQCKPVLFSEPPPALENCF